ncbi:MAG: peptide transporter [Flavobacteriales bacterium]|nr:MAG: peptide transporter [Flavobacteriales bacterium]
MGRRKKDIASHSLSYYAIQRLKKDKLAMFGLFVIAFTTFIAITGSLIRPDSSAHANDQKLQLRKKHPGFKITMIKVRKNNKVETTFFWERMFFGGKEKQYKEIPIHSYEFAENVIIVEEYTGMNEDFPGKKIPIHLADVLYKIDTDNKFQEDTKGNMTFYVDGELTEQSIEEMRKIIEEKNIITKRFWFGADLAGRDMLSRLMAGTIVSLSVGFISVFISLVIGILLGSIGGFFKGWVDDIIMWVINVVWSIPTLLLVIAITFALGKGFWQIFVAVGLTMWVEVARVVRGQVISLREKEFVEAGRALGFSNFRLISRHVLPNVMGPVIVISAANFASAILIESGLSFLGIGIQPPMVSWGKMIKDHYGFIVGNEAFLSILPGLAISMMVFAFMLVGNGLRDALDTTATFESDAKNIPTG